MKATRSEEQVLHDLEVLAGLPGFIHAVAFFCFRDNFVQYSADLTPQQMATLYSSSRLIRTEISTLMGLVLKTPIDWGLPDPTTLGRYIDDAEALLQELHDALNAPMYEILQSAMTAKSTNLLSDPFSSGAALREPIFYGAESAYSFQYRDLTPIKYSADSPWLVANKGYSIEDATTVVSAIVPLAAEKLLRLLHSFTEKPPNEWTVLPAFEFAAEELVATTGLSISVVESVLHSFSLDDKGSNEHFRHLNDFNAYNAYPIIATSEAKYVCLQQASLLEAFYETPFYWMVVDKSYVDQAMTHRGAFLERFAYDRLKLVFGVQHVWSNVLLLDSRNTRVGEIDTLVVFGNRAIIVQAKSKRLTLEARKGNDYVIKEDFKKSVQASYDQGLSCAALIGDPNHRLLLPNGQELRFEQEIDRAYVFCLVSDHYPALSAQARQFLSTQDSDRVPPPFVMDVFLLDTMTEMLGSPLRFLSYVDRRVTYNDRVMASHELTILSYHLKQNLWIEDEINLVQLGDDISTDLDLAMMVRRDGIPGSDTPEGILTKMRGSIFEHLLNQIDRTPQRNAVDLGMVLLALSGDAAEGISRGMERASALAIADGAPHDFTMTAGGIGITVHISNVPLGSAEPRLRAHCEKKKYQQRAKTWFGLLVTPGTLEIRLVGKLAFPWTRDSQIEAALARMPGTRMFSRPRSAGGKKVGRNDRCPCGSGKKFKKCCI